MNERINSMLKLMMAMILSGVSGNLLADEVPFMIGNTDINQANIHYENPRSNAVLSTAQTRALVKKLYQTEALNQSEVNAQLNLPKSAKTSEGFAVSNPYYPRYEGNEIALPKVRTVTRNGKEVSNPEGYQDPYQGFVKEEAGEITFFQQEEVTRWFSEVSHSKAASQEVCAVKFSDGQQKQYQLRTFPTLEKALKEGWVPTHQYRCGTCSTLQDLAVYIGIPYQAAPISACTRQARGNFDKLEEVKQCIVDAVGFTEMCAESWAYNGIHTGAVCWKDCVAARGKPLVVNQQSGELNGCLWCDEKKSGPGFKYSAGRTRRNSGLNSAIARPNDTLFHEADHINYFVD